MDGCDYQLIKDIERNINYPIVYKGGSSSYKDIENCFKHNINALASSSIFIMKQKNGGIVLNYPSNSFKESVC